MSQSTEVLVPDGYYPPFAVVSDTDHGAYIIIAVSLGITFVLLSSFIRAFIRISFAQRAGLDDSFLAAATVGGAVITGEKEYSLTRQADSCDYTVMYNSRCMLTRPGPVDRSPLAGCD
jgi:hypothetical protein